MLVLSILSIDDTQRNISLNGSSRTFLFGRSGELDAQFFPKRVSLKTHTTTVKEVNENTLVPWFSTLYIFIVITRTLFTVTECAINSLTITGYNNLPQRKAWKPSFDLIWLVWFGLI